jgi:Fibronectin type III domain
MFRLEQTLKTLRALVTALGVCAFGHVAAQSVNFGWTPAVDPTVVGYNVHFGISSGQYTQTLNVPGASIAAATVSSGLSPGITYFFAVRAYNAANTESPNSNEVSLAIPTPTPTPSATPSPTASPTATPSPTPVPTASPSPTGTPSASPSPTVTPTPVPSPTPVPTPTPGSLLIGNTAVFTGADNGNAGLLLASKTSLAQPAVLQSLSFYVSKIGGSLWLGIYSDVAGLPSQLVASCPSFVPVKGWNTRAVSAPILLPAGPYWLAYAPSSNVLSFVKATAGLGSVYVTYPFSMLPPVFPGGGVVVPVQWSFYATLNTGVPTPTPTATPAPTFAGWNAKLAAEEALSPTQAQLDAWVIANPPAAD